MWCSQDFPLSELRTHLLTCNCNVFDDNVEDDVLVLSDQSSSVLEDCKSSVLSSATVTASDVVSLSTDPNHTVPSSFSVLSHHSLVAQGSSSNPVFALPSTCRNTNQAEPGPPFSQSTATISDTTPHPLEETEYVFPGSSSEPGSATDQATGC